MWRLIPQLIHVAFVHTQFVLQRRNRHGSVTFQAFGQIIAWRYLLDFNALKSKIHLLENYTCTTVIMIVFIAFQMHKVLFFACFLSELLFFHDAIM
jgi:hypothetical protein